MVCENTAAIVAGFADEEEEDEAYAEIIAHREKRKLSHRTSPAFRVRVKSPLEGAPGAPPPRDSRRHGSRTDRRRRTGMSWKDDGPMICEVSDIQAGFDCEHEEELHREHIIAHREQEKQRRQSTYEDHN